MTRALEPVEFMENGPMKYILIATIIQYQPFFEGVTLHDKRIAGISSVTAEFDSERACLNVGEVYKRHPKPYQDVDWHCFEKGSTEPQKR